MIALLLPAVVQHGAEDFLQGSIHCVKASPVSLSGFCSTISTTPATLDPIVFPLSFPGITGWELSIVDFFIPPAPKRSLHSGLIYYKTLRVAQLGRARC